MQPNNHADIEGAEDDWRERFCLAWEAGVEVVVGLVGIGVGLLILAAVVGLIVALPIPAAIIIAALIVAAACQR